MVNHCLIFPQVFGLKSNINLPEIQNLSISLPDSDKVYNKRIIGIDDSLIFKVFEIENCKELSNKKCALFMLCDQGSEQEPITKCFQDENEYKQKVEEIDQRRKLIEQQLQGNCEKRVLSNLVELIKKTKTFMPINYAMDKTVTFSYLMDIIESFSFEVL